MHFGDNISLINFPELDEVDFEIASRSIKDSISRVSNSVGDNFSFSISVKKSANLGLRSKHFVSCKLSSPGLKLINSSSSGWLFLSTLQSSLKKLEVEAKALAKQ